MAIKSFVDGNSTAQAYTNDMVFVGAATGTQTIQINAGVTGVVVDANIEKFVLAGNLSTYRFAATAAGTSVQDANGVIIATIPSLNQDAAVVFADGSATLKQTGGSSFTLGGAALASTASAVTAASMGAGFTATNTVALSGATTVNEGASVVYTVTAGSIITGSAVTVPYTLTGTATAGTDYTGAASGTFTIPVGSSTTTLTLPVISDATTEGAETINITLGTPSSSFTVVAGQGTVTTTVVDTSLTVIGQNLSLTTGFDVITGTSANDTISSIGGTGATSSVGDIVDGGLGTDTFRIFSDGTVLLPTLISIENLLINDNIHQDTNVSTSALSSITSLTLQGGVSIDGSNTVVTLASGQTLTLDGIIDADTANATSGDGTVSIAQSSSQTSTTLTLKDVGTSTSASTALGIGLAGSGITTLNLSANTGANHINVFNAGGLLNTVNVTGTGTVTNWTALPTTVSKLDLTGATGTQSWVVSGAAARSVVGGAGNDTISFGTSGSDYIGAENSTSSLRDTVNGGDGTDTLIITIEDAVQASVATQTTISNVEVLRIGDAWTDGTSFDSTKFVGVTEISLAAATAGTSTLTLNSGNTITLRGDAAATGTITTGFTVGGVGGTDSLTLKLASFDIAPATNAAAVGTTFNGVEILNINSGTAIADTAILGAVSVVPSAGVTSKIVATGASPLTFGGIATTSEIDASGLTGVLTITGVPANAIRITGGSDADLIRGSASADLLTGNNGADTFRGLAGNDSIILAETTSAADIVIFQTTGADNGTDTVTGFTPGTDKINLDLVTTSTAVVATGAAVTFTAAANNVLFFPGGAAGDADSSAAAITFMNANSAYTDSGNTFYAVVVDNNSTAVYQILGNAGGNEFTGDTLTLMGTIDTVLSASDILFAGA